MFAALLTILVLALIVAAALVIRQQNLRLRQMRHHERLAAIAGAAKTGDSTYLEGEQMMSDVTTQHSPQVDPAAQWKDPSTYTHWLRVSTLGLAFLLMFGGIGMLTAFLIIPDHEMQKLWSVGLIPMMAGFGLLLFSLLSGKLVRNNDD